MLKYCNIDYNALLDAVQHVPFPKIILIRSMHFFLKCLKHTMKVKIVALSYYPLRLPSRFGLRILIHIQSIRLLFSTIFSPSNARILTSTEQAEILSLIEVAQDNESIYVGAYLLLDNPVAAKIHFDKLPEESQKFFESCPIYHFYAKWTTYHFCSDRRVTSDAHPPMVFHE